MANKDLLKEAIAEAKTIRESAIANAREALEETITPHLRDMLAAKLQEMETEEVDEVVEDAVAEEVNEEEELAEVTEEEVTEAEVSEEELAVAEADDDSEESEEEAEEEEGEGEEAEEEVEVKDMEVEDLKDMIRDILAQELGHEGEEELDAVDGEMDAADDMVSADDEIDLNELLAQLEEMAKEDEMDEAKHDDEMDEAKHEDKDAMEEAKHDDEMDEAMHDDEEAMEEGQGNVDAHEENPHDQLEEALAAVEQLKAELQEVNLLNSKLLYVNKLFKANNLTESQKVNVITAFDKAETVKEVKLVYETVSENLVSTPAKQTVKEHKSFASAPAGNSTKGEVINEVSDAVRRMQKLAGIIS
jgi:hypothetical protein